MLAFMETTVFDAILAKERDRDWYMVITRILWLRSYKYKVKRYTNARPITSGKAAWRARNQSPFWCTNQVHTKWNPLSSDFRHSGVETSELSWLENCSWRQTEALPCFHYIWQWLLLNVCSTAQQRRSIRLQRKKTWWEAHFNVKESTPLQAT